MIMVVMIVVTMIVTMKVVTMMIMLITQAALLLPGLNAEYQTPFRSSCLRITTAPTLNATTPTSGKQTQPIFVNLNSATPRQKKDPPTHQETSTGGAIAVFTRGLLLFNNHPWFTISLCGSFRLLMPRSRRPEEIKETGRGIIVSDARPHFKLLIANAPSQSQCDPYHHHHCDHPMLTMVHTGATSTS